MVDPTGDQGYGYGRGSRLIKHTAHLRQGSNYTSLLYLYIGLSKHCYMPLSDHKITNRNVHPFRCRLSLLSLQAHLVVLADLVSAVGPHRPSTIFVRRLCRFCHSGSPARMSRRPSLVDVDARSAKTRLHQPMACRCDEGSWWSAAGQGRRHTRTTSRHCFSEKKVPSLFTRDHHHHHHHHHHLLAQ